LIAEFLVKEVDKYRRLLVLPPLYYGLCRTTAPFPGTISISFDTLRVLVRDVCINLIHQNVTNIILISGHLGSAHLSALELVSERLCRRYNKVQVAVFRIDRVLRKIQNLLEDPKDMHAGEVETSLMLALHPERVDRKSIVDEHPSFPDHLRCINFRKYMKSGVMGSASLASKEKGVKLFEHLVKELLMLIDHLTIP